MHKGCQLVKATVGRRVWRGVVTALFVGLATAANAAASPPPGTILTVAGTGTSGYSGDGGRATMAELHYPNSIAIDREGNRIVVDTDSNAIRVIAVSRTNPGYPLSTGCPTACGTSGVTWVPGDIYTIAGTGTSGYSGDGGPATAAEFNLDYSNAVTLDRSGNVLVTDVGNQAVRIIAVSPTDPGYVLPSACPNGETCGASLGTWKRGDIYTVAGNGTGGYAGDGGPAASAEFKNGPDGLALDRQGNVIMADQFSDVIRVLAVSSTNPGYRLPATCRVNESLCGPSLTTWRKGYVYTIAGTGQAGFSGDGGSASSAQLQGEYLTGVSVDSRGDVVFSDDGDNVVRVIAMTPSNPGYTLPARCRTNESSCRSSLTTWRKGDIYSIVGTGTSAYAGDGGPADAADLNLGYGGFSSLDARGNIVIADNDNNVVRVVAESASDPGYVLARSCPAAEASCGASPTRWKKGDIYTIAGTGTQGYSGDGGRATSGELYLDYGDGLTFDRLGDLFFVDTGNNVVREVTVAQPPTIPRAPKALPGHASVTVSWTAASSSAGFPITRYAVYDATRSRHENYSARPACTTTAGTRHCTITGLTNGVTYFFTVRAFNSVGAGPPSAQVSAKPIAKR